MTPRRIACPLALLASAWFAPNSSAQQPLDSAYSAQITQLTPTDTRWKFTTELVSSLPASSTVPTPLKVLGYVPGTLGRLSYVAELNRYFDALAAAAPNRVRKFSLGKSEEGRESIVVAISDEANIANLEQNRLALGRLADPRGLAPADRARLIKDTKPTYWLSGSIHSPETGSPEMLMELAYRLAAAESDFVKDIRANVITLISPVTEVDGVPTSSYLGGVLPGSLLTTLGAGLCFTPLAAAATSGVPPRLAGLASGVVNLARLVGITVGVAVLGSAMAAIAGAEGARIATMLGGLVAVATVGHEQCVITRDEQHGGRADQEGDGGARHAMDQAAEALHVALAGCRQHRAGAEEEQALEQRMVEDMKEGGRQRQRRPPPPLAEGTDRPGDVPCVLSTFNLVEERWYTQSRINSSFPCDQRL